MEHRHDLEMILFSGLSPAERLQTARTIREADAAKLRHKRSQHHTDAAEPGEMDESLVD